MLCFSALAFLANPRVGHLGLPTAEPTRCSWHLSSDRSWWAARGGRGEGLRDGMDSMASWEASCLSMGWVQFR